MQEHLHALSAFVCQHPSSQLDPAALHRVKWVILDSLTAIAAGMRIGLALALILMVLSEWVVSTSGLGFSLINSQQHFDMVGMWAAMVALALAGYLVNTAFLAAENRALAWHKGVRGHHE